MPRYDMELDGKNGTFRSPIIPETQSLLYAPSPYSPPFGKTTDTIKEEEVGFNDFPEGGARAWASVIGSFCMLFMSQGAIYAFGVYQDFYTRIFLNECSPSQIAWIGSVQLFLIFFPGIFVGKLFDEGYFHHLIITGSVIYVFSFFMLSFVQPHNYYKVLVCQGVGVGLGMGMIYLPSVTIGFHYFKRRRGIAVGFGSTGSALGGIVQTIGLNYLINGRVGFAWGVRIFGFIFLVLAIIGNVLMRPGLPPRRPTQDQPKPDVKRIVWDVPLLLSILGSGLLLFSVFFPFVYIQLFAILHGISTNLAFYSITILNTMTLVGRIVSGFFADRYGYVNAVLISSFCLGIVSFAMIKATTPSGLIAFTVFYGFFAGGCTSSRSSTALSSYVANTNEIGFVLGYGLFIQSFLVLIAQPIAGTIIDAPQYRWNRAIIAVSIILCGGFALVLVSRMMLARRKNIWKV